mmetsp:Transcript_22590/g.53406  ORF Transcript_22590/g.53406 Transcript_22590/m.53406 type:complete len:240 (+) Transcript_22590:153-872(+)
MVTRTRGDNQRKGTTAETTTTEVKSSVVVASERLPPVRVLRLLNLIVLLQLRVLRRVCCQEKRISSDRKALGGSTSREDDDNDDNEDHDGGAAIDVPSSISSGVGALPGSATAARSDHDGDQMTTDMDTTTSTAPTVMAVTGTTATTTAASTTPIVFDMLMEEDARVLHVLSFVSIEDLAKSRCVSVRFNNLCERPIIKHSKKTFQTNEELKGAVRMYCTGDKSQKNKAHCIYGRLITI